MADRSAGLDVAAHSSRTEPYIDVSYKALAVIKALEEVPEIELDDEMVHQLHDEVTAMSQKLFYKIRELAAHIALGPLRR
ncbi:MAG: hypothetical protein JJU36_15195 [Phycisphaeraceae bacterium]|nr:hypothetical protein [Phycisphaeraceae bacterium]